MECRVCGKQYEGSLCPRCKFPNVEFSGSAEYAEQTIRAMADKHRVTFFENVSIGVVIYHWKDENGICVIDTEEQVSFGSLQAVQNKVVWINQMFARIQDVEQITVKFYISHDGSTITKEVVIPNLQDARLQEIGVKVDEKQYATLLLRNGVGSAESAPFSILGIM